MAIKKVSVCMCTCERCGNTWIPKTQELQKIKELKTCPKCKNPYWNVPKKKKG